VTFGVYFSPMSSKISLLVISALIVSACGAGVDVSTDTTSGAASTGTASADTEIADALPERSVPSGDGAVENSTADQNSGVTGEAAPDFTLALGDGSTFTLSETDRPVYLVFWAEW